MTEIAVGTILDALGSNKRFDAVAYYVVSFARIPSGARFAMSIERTNDLMTEIMKTLDLESRGFELIFKNWVTDDFRRADRNRPLVYLLEDYPFEFFYKSQSERMTIHMMAHDFYLSMEFLYDASKTESERWALDICRQLRANFGAQDKPKFKVLTYQDGMFNAEEVSTADFTSINVGELYNDDFAPIDAVILDSITKRESGIILLHGEPGTGKTTYIKHLISKFKETEFIFVQNDFVRELLKPTFISFLLQNKNSVLIIEDAEKVVVSRDNNMEDSVVSTILQLTDGLFSDFLNLKIICTFNTDIDRIDKALLRKGRMIAKYNFEPLTAEKTSALAKKLGNDKIKGRLTLADIFEFEKMNFQETGKKNIGFV